MIWIGTVVIALIGIWLIAHFQPSRISPIRAIIAFLVCVVAAELLKLVLFAAVASGIPDYLFAEFQFETAVSSPIGCNRGTGRTYH